MPISQTITAPIKINFFLHIIGRRDDGYHNLQSLVSFANYGDIITIKPASTFSFTITGDFQSELPKNNADNLILKAAHKISLALGKNLNIAITLDKKIPIGAGLGGGSADAAATIKALLGFWDATLPQGTLNDILLSLGADVPVCYQEITSYMEGIGDIITPLPSSPKIPALLIYPNEFCSTPDVFNSYMKPFTAPLELPQDLSDTEKFIMFIQGQRNDLTSAACRKTPAIRDILGAIQAQSGCQVARMSGSGSACFGLFDTEENSKKAATTIQKERPNWWVRPTLIQ